jgi:AcrR family transcriptional regulator
MAGVGARDIARKAGVSPGTVTYHFAGVQEIFAEAITLGIEEYYAPLLAQARQRRPLEALRGLVDALFTDDTQQHWRLWFEYWRAGVRDDEFVRRQSERYAEWHSELRRILTSGRGDGDLSCTDPDEAAVRFMALVDGLALQWLRGVPPLTAAQAREHLHRFVDELSTPQ